MTSILNVRGIFHGNKMPCDDSIAIKTHENANLG